MPETTYTIHRPDGRPFTTESALAAEAYSRDGCRVTARTGAM